MRPFDKSPVDLLRVMKRTKPVYEVFEFNSINTYVCQRIVETVSEQALTEFFGERVWRRIGAQNDAYIGLDKQGRVVGFAIMNSTLCNLGRSGMFYTPSSKNLSAAPIVPEAVVRKFQTGLRLAMYTKGAVGAPTQKEFFTLPIPANQNRWGIVTPDGDLLKAGGAARGSGFRRRTMA